MLPTLRLIIKTIEPPETRIYSFGNPDDPFKIIVKERDGVLAATSPDCPRLRYTSQSSAFPSGTSLDEMMQETARGFVGQIKDMYSRSP